MNDERGRVGEVAKRDGEIMEETVREIYGMQKETETERRERRQNITEFILTHAICLPALNC